MKRSVRLTITGSVQSMFFEQFVKQHASSLNIKGYFRKLEDGRVEIFAEGDNQNVEKMIDIAKTGPQHAQIRNIEKKEEKFQDFREFKIIKI